MSRRRFLGVAIVLTAPLLVCTLLAAGLLFSTLDVKLSAQDRWIDNRSHDAIWALPIVRHEGMPLAIPEAVNGWSSCLQMSHWGIDVAPGERRRLVLDEWILADLSGDVYVLVRQADGSCRTIKESAGQFIIEDGETGRAAWKDEIAILQRPAPVPRFPYLPWAIMLLGLAAPIVLLCLVHAYARSGMKHETAAREATRIPSSGKA